MQIDPQQIALGIQQPWADLILSGEKTLEIRSQNTNVRGSIYVYASLKKSTAADATSRRTNAELSELPTGVVVGTVEIVGSRLATQADLERACLQGRSLQGLYAWELNTPVRFTEPLLVEHRPFGIWFYPFRDRKQI